MKTVEAITLPANVRTTGKYDAFPSVAGNRACRIPLRRNSDGSLELLMLEQPSNPKHGVIFSVSDPLGINGQTQIGLRRAARINPMAEDKCGCRTPNSIPESKCDFCSIVKEAPIISLDNPVPFGPLLHKVVLSGRHIDSADEIGLTEIADAWEEFYRLADVSAKLDGLTVGMNFGAYILSGASQIHFHYQVAGIGFGNYNAGDALGAMCEAYKSLHNGADYLGDYLSAIRQAGLLIKENRHAALYVPFAQRFSHEMQIMALDRDVGNLRDTMPDQRAALAELEHHAIHILAKEQLHTFNQIWYTTRFSTDNNHGQRIIVSICPRTSIYAFYELSHNYVIDQFPWDSAQVLRRHSQKIDAESR